jgi:hypothetical protein
MSKNPTEALKADEFQTSLSEPPFDWRDFRPEMLPGDGRFAVELTTYRDHLDSLLAESGRYVAIKGREIIGIYDDLEAAVEESSRFAPEPVLVKQIVEKEPIRQVGYGRS